MKKKIIFILSVLWFCTVNSQTREVSVQYKAVKGKIINTETLIATNEKAVYLTDSLSVENKNNIESDKNSRRITIHLKKTIKLAAIKYYLRKNSPIVYYTMDYLGKPTLVKDSLPNYSWDLSSEATKKIGNYLCQKATANFRGSEITAWYTRAISVPFGPWKFKGLPGLILELYTTNSINKYSWRATNIKFYTHKNSSFKKDETLPVISLKTVVTRRKNRFIKKMKLIMARTSSKGAVPLKGKLHRDGVEKKYEWEN